MQRNQTEQNHIPVLLEQVLKYLAPQKGETYLDVTAGYGGHATAVLERTQNPSGAMLVDRDKNAAGQLKRLFGKSGAEIVNKDFYAASQGAERLGRRFDMILADLGVSSPHLNMASRGFSFGQEAPLDMRMDQSQELTADDIVNGYSEKELASILKRYGEEPKAHAIARQIITHRPIRTTTELAQIVAKVWPGHHKINPATRTFQAIRIAVNDELGQLEKSLPLWVKLLNPGGRLAVISFHSLEDRLVKEFFQSESSGEYDASLIVLTKHPSTGDTKEIAFNPRARSAKLRAAAKIKTKERSRSNANSGKKQLPNL